MALDSYFCLDCGESKKTPEMEAQPLDPDRFKSICKVCDRKARRLVNRERRWPDGLKACSCCKNFFTFSEFYEKPTAWDGLQSRCMYCMNADKVQARGESDLVLRRRQLEETGGKTCTACGEQMSMDNFRQRTGGIGHHSACRPCEAKQRKRQRQEARQRRAMALAGVEVCSVCEEEFPLAEVVEAEGSYECQECHAELNEEMNEWGR